MARRRTTGRLEAARKLLLNAAQKALEEQQYVIRYRAKSYSDATNLRQACYTYQKSWASKMEDQIEADGLDPAIELPKTLLNASWPSASIRYEFAEGDHWLLFEFKRLGTDPSWEDHVKANLFAGPPKRTEPEVIDNEELQQIIGEIK